jgi:hypothetical protein
MMPGHPYNPIRKSVIQNGRPTVQDLNHVRGGIDMLVLITGENIDSGYLIPPDQLVQILEQALVPSFQMLAEWERQGRLKGGVHLGERDGAFVIEAESFEELDRMMNSLPFFGSVKWSTQPLIPFSSFALQFPENVANLKQMSQAGGQPPA